jgi:hypothetical protein
VNCLKNIYSRAQLCRHKPLLGSGVFHELSLRGKKLEKGDGSGHAPLRFEDLNR